MRLLIFCTGAERPQLATAFKDPIVPDNLGDGSLEKFFQDPDAVMLVTKRFATGWRTPIGTALLFSEGFPTTGPLRAQAEGRTRRVSPGGV